MATLSSKSLKLENWFLFLSFCRWSDEILGTYLPQLYILPIFLFHSLILNAKKDMKSSQLYPGIDFQMKKGKLKDRLREVNINLWRGLGVITI